MRHFFLRILPHITIILSVMFIVFWVLDIFNPAMEFLSSSLSNTLLLALCVASLTTSIALVAYERSSWKRSQADDDLPPDQKRA